MNANERLEYYRGELAARREEAQNIATQAETQDLTAEQIQRVDEIDKETAELQRQHDSQMRLIRIAGNPADGQPDQLSPEMPAAPAPTKVASNAGYRIDPVTTSREMRMGGFRSHGDFMRTVALAYTPGGERSGVSQRDAQERLHNMARMQPTNFSSTTTAADGGYAVPPDFRQFIWEALMGPESLLPLTDQYSTSYNTVTVPKDEGPVWSSTGPQAYWVAEGAQKTDSKIAIGEQQLKLEKLAALLPVTDQLLEDSPMMNSYLQSKVPRVMRFAVDQAIVSGDGSGKPTGIVGHASAVAVSRSGGAGTIELADLAAMWTRMPMEWRRSAVWLMNPDHEGTLIQLAFNPSPTIQAPIFLPGQVAATEPFGTIFGRPMIPHEACPGANTPGDIILWAPQSYFSVLKSGSEVQQDVSIHLYFDYDITTFRFVVRVNGKPWLSAPIARADGSNTNTFSGIVTLAAGV